MGEEELTGLGKRKGTQRKQFTDLGGKNEEEKKKDG